jgi:hypothetical protein
MTTTSIRTIASPVASLAQPSASSLAPRPSGPGYGRPGSCAAARPHVSCVFCREPIEVSSFTPGKLDPRILSTACTNCGLLVSATRATLAAWSRPEVSCDLAVRERARRVARGTRAILDRVGASGFPEQQAS